MGGALEPAQITRLGAALARHPGCPKLIVVHHPPHMGEGGHGWDHDGPRAEATPQDMLLPCMGTGVVPLGNAWWGDPAQGRPDDGCMACSAPTLDISHHAKRTYKTTSSKTTSLDFIDNDFIDFT